MRPRWDDGPAELLLVRHGESAGNEANTAAEESGAEVLDLHDRDADVELSETGRDQARSLRRWVDGLEAADRPTAVVASPYRRALRAGAGKVALATVEGVLAGLAPLVPEAGLVPLPADDGGAIDPALSDAIVDEVAGVDVLLTGTGLVDADHATSLLDRMLPRTTTTVVLDALGSAYLSAHADGLHHLEGRAVLTVNPSELAHTAGTTADEVAHDPVGVATGVARRCRLVVVCGGTSKHVVTPDGDAWVIEGGGPGLATSGSGDVQAGILAGLLGRGADPAQAAVWAGYVHARCGERLAAEVGPLGFLPRELPAQVPVVLAELG